MANWISRASIFLPRYSGVRPTIRPATKTDSRAMTTMMAMPEPTPPGRISPNCIRNICNPPPKGMKLACMELTEPFEAPVVTTDQTVEAGAPKRTSLPSMLTELSTWAATRAGAGWVSITYMAALAALSRIRAAAARARMSRPAIAVRPKAKKAAQPMTLIATAVSRLVMAFGFSNGWAPLTLKTPPPLMPSCLIATWLAAGNSGKV